MTAFERLRSLVPPPQELLEPADPAAWPRVEAELGTALPADYKQFVEHYGTGVFDDFLWVLSPFATELEANLLAAAGAAPGPPGQGGLLPFGGTDNGDLLCWRTGGDPDGWTVVVVGTRAHDEEGHAAGMVAFLARLAAGELASELLPEDVLTKDRHTFRPG